MLETVLAPANAWGYECQRNHKVLNLFWALWLVLIILFGKTMNITSRYSDIPDVHIDPAKVPEQFRHLIALAKAWSISDDVELDAYIEAASEETKKEFAAAFTPHFAGLQMWSESCSHISPQPDELVLFDTASNAAATVFSILQ